MVTVFVALPWLVCAVPTVPSVRLGVVPPDDARGADAVTLVTPVGAGVPSS